MSTMVRFDDGQLLDFSVDDVFFVSLNAKSIRHCVILCIDNELIVYRILRKNREVGLIRTLLNNAEINLKTHYQFTFKGLVWGQPAITYVNGVWWWMLNECLIIDTRGNLSLPFLDILKRYEIENPQTDKLLAFFESARSSAIYTIPGS